MDHWTNGLSSEVYERLCNCTTRKDDLSALVNARWNWYKRQGKEGVTKEAALIDVLELLDCNGKQFDLTIEEWNELKD